MRRKTFDALMTAGGMLVAVGLLVAGGLLTWAHSFVHGQVTTQLSAQHITFPAAADITDRRMADLKQYAGQQLTTGAQAKAYADSFIAIHLADMGGGKTYSELSAASRANPSDTALAGQVQTAFRGETLRGLLLNAYAFDTMATVAAVGAWICFGLASLLLALAAFGVMHLRRTPAEEELVVPGWHPEHATGS